MEYEVEDLEDLQVTLRALHSEASEKHDDALSLELKNLESKSDNLELYGLTMMQLKQEVGVGTLCVSYLLMKCTSHACFMSGIVAAPKSEVSCPQMIH